MSLTLEEQAEFSAMQTLLKLIAPMTLQAAGISPDNVERFAASLADQFRKMDLPVDDAVAAMTIKEANAKAIEDLYAQVAATMRDGDSANEGPTAASGQGVDDALT